MAYTAEQLMVEGLPVTDLCEFTLTGCPGEHTSLRLGGYVEAGKGEAFLYGLPEHSPLSVSVKGEQGSTLLFSGVITSVTMTGGSQSDYIQAEAKSRSVLLDLKKQSRSFQDTAMTYGQLAAEILRDYPDSDGKLSVPDQALGEPAIQYRETDWEFLTRMFSMLWAPLYADPGVEGLKLYLGIPESAATYPEYTRLTVAKELGEYRYRQQEGVDTADVDFVVYTIETRESVHIYDTVLCQGQEFLVRRMVYELKQGVLCGQCELQRKAGMRKRRCYPMDLIGTALKGEITEVAGERVKVHLEIDAGNQSPGTHWFPFSTLSASPDGSGWYYMPEKGDQVRVYFPSKYMKDAIAISAVSVYEGVEGGNPDKMGKPSTKSLGNSAGQTMSLGADGICLECKGKAARLTISPEGSLILEAEKTISIVARETLEISTETDMEFYGSENVAVFCAMGGMLHLDDAGNLIIRGTEVFVD